MHDILMPEVGKSGALTIGRWLKQAGQSVAKGDVIAQVESEQGLAELESGHAGVLAEIVVPAGKTAKVGTVIGRIGDDGKQVVETKSQPSVREERQIKSDSGPVVPVLMPQAGNSMEEGTIVKWRVKEGDRIAKGQVIFEVETDKATMEVEATDGGRLAKIVVPEGGVQKVKEPVAFLAENDADVRSAGAGGQETTAPPAGVAAHAATTNANTSSNVTPVLMPQAGNSMEEGTIVQWRVKEGDRITKGQVIFEIETDKATMEVEATDTGRLAKIVVPAGGIQKVKEPVAYLAENDADVRSVGASRQESTASAAPIACAEKIPVVESPVCAGTTSANGRMKASPAARKLAAEKGLDLASVGVGSGPGGRILSTDLAKAKSASTAVASKPSTASKEKEVASVQTLTATQVARHKMTKMRKAIASNLQMSKQTIPHFYLRATVNADAMMVFYKGEKAKYPCSVNDVVTLACAKAIIEFPALRSKIEKDEIVEYPAVNIGVAVGTDDGLTVPVLLNAHAMNLQQVAASTKRIVENARAGKLEGYGQGNFTITNLGMFGVEEFSAIVNPPEPAILAVGAAREAVIVKDGFMKPGRVMTLTLSCDHRLVDGLLAAKFMARLKELLENPTVLV